MLENLIILSGVSCVVADPKGSLFCAGGGRGLETMVSLVSTIIRPCTFLIPFLVALEDKVTVFALIEPPIH